MENISFICFYFKLSFQNNLTKKINVLFFLLLNMDVLFSVLFLSTVNILTYDYIYDIKR